MIYLITGAPGSGKTLYAVSTLVQELAAQKIQKDGKEVNRRVVVDNIPDLLIDHELIAPGKLEGGQIIPEQGQGVWNWYEWCQPGDVIVIDEVQRHWRPRGNGAKVPAEIAMLETHRHKGVDFVIVTQSPMLLDQNVRRLVGRHQHVRRLFGMERAIIYDWDACSQSIKPSSSTGKTFFNYPKSAYALYKSSELHTKQKQKIPWVIFIPVLAIVGAATLGPKAFAAFTGAVSGKGVQGISGAAPAPKPAASAPVPVSTVPGAPPGFVLAGDNTPKPAPVAPAEFPQLQKQVAIAGCIYVKGRCGCFDAQGGKVDATESMCKEKTGDGMGKAAEFPDSPRLTVISEAEAETIRFAFLKK